MRSRPIRILAIVIAAVLALGSFSIWAVSTQERASVGIGEIYEVEIESNEELNNILEQTSGSSGGVEEDKNLFDIFPNEDYPRDHMSGSLHLYNADEVEQHLNSLTIEFEAEGQIIGNLTLRNGGFSFRIEEDDGWDEVSIDTTGSGSYTRKEDADQFDLHFMIQIDEVQEGVVSEEDIAVGVVQLEVDSTSGGDVVEPGEGTFEYEEGTIVDLEAIAEEDSPFVEWSGDNETIEDTTSNQTTIEMLGDYSIIAVFDVETYDLVIDSTEGGSVVDPGEDTFTYESGEIVELEAVPEEGYRFVEWTGDIDTIEDPTSNQTTIEMLDNYSITAEFAPITYELTINSTDGGEVTEPGEGAFEYEHGTIVDLEAVAFEDAPFVKWSGDNETIEDPSSNQTTIEILDDYTITAVFDVEAYDLTTDSTEGGSVVEPGEGTYTYDAGDVVELEAVPEEGYEFVEWTGDTGTIEDPTSNETTIEMLDDYHITAEFDLVTHTLSIDSTEGGSVVQPGEGSFEYDKGDIVDLEAVSDEGYLFIQWTGDTENIEDPTSNQTTIEMLDDHSITAEFLEEPFFEVEIVDYDDPVIEGQTVSVDYTVTNTGEIEDTQDIEFTVEDEEGNIVRSVTDQDVTIGPGETYDETFTWTTDGEDAGEYEAIVTSEDDEDSVTVTVIEPPAQLYPVEELTTDNLEGDIEYLQHDPESTDAYENWYEAVDTDDDTELEVGMDDPDSELEGIQTIGVLLRRTDIGTRTDPDVTIELYQDGTLIDTLAEDLEINDPEGEVHYFDFDTEDLIDPSGQGITLEFVGEHTGGQPGVARNTIEYGAIEWEVNTVGTNSIDERTLETSEEELSIERNVSFTSDVLNRSIFLESTGGAGDVHLC